MQTNIQAASTFHRYQQRTQRICLGRATFNGLNPAGASQQNPPWLGCISSLNLKVLSCAAHLDIHCHLARHRRNTRRQRRVIVQLKDLKGHAIGVVIIGPLVICADGNDGIWADGR